jgi:hypothetical protein
MNHGTDAPGKEEAAILTEKRIPASDVQGKHLFVEAASC